MPLLIYSCKACGEEVEFLLDHGQEPDEACVCGALRWLRGMPKRISIRFKGSGFYKNDSRSKANGKGGDSAGPAGRGTGEGKAKVAAKGKDGPSREKGAS
ncbi:zinc ribbon domain-containing protein [bacterium]|nr:zinc ribbon domain-containing protein [bacterium]